MFIIDRIEPRFGYARLPLLRDAGLIFVLVRCEVMGRYRGSLLGVLWSLITPLLMLAVYTFVFGCVFRSRWAGNGEHASTSEFAVILFSGLIVFQIFSEVISRAPGVVLANTNYVKKVVFPLEILVPVVLGSALFHTAVSLAVLDVFMVLVMGGIPLTALWFPVVLAPYCLLILGIGWFLSSVGVFYRDIGQLVGTVLTALMFLSPIFFPLSALPEWIQPWVVLNPIAWPVEQARNVLIFGRGLDVTGFGAYSLSALLVACAGFVWFQKTRKGFADVL